MSKWIEIKVFAFPEDAYMAKAYLESEGIAVFLQGEISAQIFNVNGGVRLMVPEINLDKAVELLEKGGYMK